MSLALLVGARPKYAKPQGSVVNLSDGLWEFIVKGHINTKLALHYETPVVTPIGKAWNKHTAQLPNTEFRLSGPARVNIEIVEPGSELQIAVLANKVHTQ